VPRHQPTLSLLEVLAEVPDPRNPKGVRHPLSAILSLTVLAMLTGARSYTAIAQFGRDKGFALAHALGFRRGKTPSKSTLSVLFRALDVKAFEAALSRWIAPRLADEPHLHVCLDGKTARGSHDDEVPGHHLVAAYAPTAVAVLAQIRVDAKTNEHKAGLELLGILPIKGRLFSGDAMFCQRDICKKIIDGGGDYLFTVKDNQPSLAADIAAGLNFDEQKRRQEAAFPPLPGVRTAAGVRSADGGQGTWPSGDPYAAADKYPDEASTVGGTQTGLRTGARTQAKGERADGGSGAWDNQSGPPASQCGAGAAMGA
jgi:hypothetical protein